MKRISTWCTLALVGGLSLTWLRAEEAVVPVEKTVPAATPKPAVKHKTTSKKKKPVAKKGSTTSVAPTQGTATSTAPKTSLQTWLSRLKKKVARAQSKNTKLVAVASVRGDEASDSPPLYWKGKAAEGPVSMPELNEFDEAINTALNGDSASAKTKLENFVLAHPNSPLVGEARETLGMLNENPKP